MFFKQAEAQDVVQALKQNINVSNASGQLFVLFQQHCYALAQHLPSKDSPLLFQLTHNISLLIRGLLFSRKKMGKSYTIKYTVGQREKKQQSARHVYCHSLYGLGNLTIVFSTMTDLTNFPSL